MMTSHEPIFDLPRPGSEAPPQGTPILPPRRSRPVSRARRVRGRLGRLLRAAWHLLQVTVLAYGLGVTLFLIARVVPGERWAWVALANNFIPWWALGGFVACGLALLSRWRWLLLAVQLPGMLAFVMIYGALLAPPTVPRLEDDQPRLTVATYNILASQSDPARVVEVIRDLDADVIGLQEVGPRHADLIEHELDRRYPYRTLHPLLPVHGVALLSRYPILAESVFRPLPDSMLFLRAEIDFDGLPVTVYVVHPAPPRNAISPLGYDTTRRDTEIDILINGYLVGEIGPLIVLGDFNMSDQSAPYDDMQTLLSDAFRRAGHGLGFTYPAGSRRDRFNVVPRLVRIDYIWHNARFVALNARAYPDSGTSDHGPVSARLALQPDSRQQVMRPTWGHTP